MRQGGCLLVNYMDHAVRDENIRRDDSCGVHEDSAVVPQTKRHVRTRRANPIGVVDSRGVDRHGVVDDMVHQNRVQFLRREGGE